MGSNPTLSAIGWVLRIPNDGNAPRTAPGWFLELYRKTFYISDATISCATNQYVMWTKIKPIRKIWRYKEIVIRHPQIDNGLNFGNSACLLAASTEAFQPFSEGQSFNPVFFPGAVEL